MVVVEAAVVAPPTQVETVQAAAVAAVERPRKMLRLTHLNPVVVAPAKPPASEPASDSEESAVSDISSIEVDFRDLQLGSSWEQSYSRHAEGCAQQAEVLPAAIVAPAEEEATSALSSDHILDLLDMTDSGLTVCWPIGLDVRIARLILRRRAASATARQLCDRADPA